MIKLGERQESLCHRREYHPRKFEAGELLHPPSVTNDGGARRGIRAPVDSLGDRPQADPKG